MQCQRHLFSLPDKHHYLNCSYLSPLLKSVEEAGLTGLQTKRRPWQIGPNDFFEDSNRLRNLFARLVNAPAADDIAIMPAVSYGIATAAQNIDPGKGNSIVIAGEQFPSNVYAWKRFCNEYGCSLKIVPAPKKFETRGKRWNKRLSEAIDGDTLLVALGNVHWADGTLFNLQAIGARVHENDAYLVIDGTQSVGALPFDVQKIQPDALICAGYKWLMGPYSTALAYFNPRMQEGLPLEEGWIVRKDSENFSGLVDYQDEYQPGARRFDVGERSNFIQVPMMIAALQQVIAWGPSNIQEYCRDLTSDFIAELQELGYQVEEPASRGHHMFGIRLPKTVDADDLQHRLSQRNIHLSTRGSSLRISPHLYNDQTDIEALQEVLRSSV